ncbi:hypothetical protein KORDIASMS9_03702 [Kordia sp. SMS9]|uniref:hypothetical protein n=1 Tax=Kordia sp. SMS9 TaxID=2282170 RepID=UPI000E0DCB57|nr:hypothetical protein [Kordia sp. SMS9]AXG71445.1 hypothetical protein KORDIASMS9_03702 [Kordia sp. SMS9]
MSLITKKFYNLFWKNQTCQNLFLLSKEELLDTKTLDVDGKSFRYSLPRIIVSNVEIDESLTIDTIKYRSDNHNLQMQEMITSKMEHFGPILMELFGDKLRDSFERIVNDVKDNPLIFGLTILGIFYDKHNRESIIIENLKNYGFISHHLNSFTEIAEFTKGKLLVRKNNPILTEKNIETFLEVVKVIKELYVNLVYKALYETNQILVNSLNSEDNFKSRTKLFHYLYESGIISASMEDAYVDCTHCEPGTYRGVFQLKLDPNKLKNLKCPICAKKVKYFVPYDLHKDIYEIIREKDGLLQHALLNLLSTKDIGYKTNQLFLDDIEVDCIFDKRKEESVFVETKMYKINTTKDKLKSKLKKHFCKLSEDIHRIKGVSEHSQKLIIPILLVNIIDEEFLQEVEKEIKEIKEDQISQSIRILNITTFRSEMSL